MIVIKSVKMSVEGVDLINFINALTGNYDSSKEEVILTAVSAFVNSC